MSRSYSGFFVALALTFGIAVGVGAYKAAPNVASQLAYAAESGQAQAAGERLLHSNDFSQAFKDVAKVMRPSVVTINSVTKAKPAIHRQKGPGNQQLPEGIPDEFRRFFEERGAQGGLNMPSPEQRGSGTGVIISEDGYVLTNNHVVRGADDVKVTLSDGRNFVAKVVGTDEKTDVAVIHVEAHGLVPARMGNSDAVEVGEWVMAFGGPFGLSQTVTSGIISAKGRDNMGIADYEDFIQTDAAINPGNSGGPLVNLKGEVIGINTAIASQSGGNMGVGFAIPSNMAKMVMDHILRDGHVDRGWLGAAIQNLSEDLAQSFGVTSTDGVLIGDVVPNSPAAKAGLKSGDIVLKFNGKGVTNASQFRNAVAATAPETKVELNVSRDGKNLNLPVTIGKLDTKTAKLGSHGADKEEADAHDEIGVAVQTLTPEMAKQLGYEGDRKGVAVTTVEPGSLAFEASIRAKDVITRVGNTAVEDVDGFRAAMKEHDLAKGVRLQVMGDGVQRFVVLKSASKN